jgi:L-galactose dehydrogenase
VAQVPQPGTRSVLDVARGEQDGSDEGEAMRSTVLGRTGLKISVAGLGCGGRSRIGQRQGRSAAESTALIHEALDLGITYIDTARMYRTEEIVGAALSDGRRDKVVVSTKAAVRHRDGSRVMPSEIPGLIEDALRRLCTDRVDVFHAHAVAPQDYDYVRDEIYPALVSQRDRGTVRFLGISEHFSNSWRNETVSVAVQDGIWDVVMAGFNILNQNARASVLPAAEENNVGVEIMFAVRNILSDQNMLRQRFRELVDNGLLVRDAVDLSDPLGFLVHEGGARSVVDAAYRFVAHEPGCDVILTGTGNPAHLRENVRSIDSGPLPGADRDRLIELFGELAEFSGD